MTRNAKKIIIVTIGMCTISIAFILLLEGVVRLIYSETRLDQISKTISPHSNRIWYGRPDYNGVFFGEEVSHNSLGLRSKEKITDANIVVFGASPSYGWGVKSNETYSSLIESKSNGVFKVLNASNIGYSSYQGKKILNSVFNKVNPKVIVISYVINDVDRYRFIQNSSLSDKNVEAMSLYEKISYFISQNFITGKILRSMSLGEEHLPSPGEVRVNIDDYRRNYIEMIEQARSSGAKVILLKMPVNLHLSTISEKTKKLLSELGCISFISNSKNLYKCLAEKGKFPKSKEMVNEVRKIFAINSSKQTELYHKEIDKIGMEMGVTVIDAVSTFRKSEIFLFLDKKEDPIHPNPTGHRIIADLIYDDIERLYGK